MNALHYANELLVIAFQELLQTRQTSNYFFLLLGREDSAEILASVCQEEDNFEVLKRCYIQIYPTSY